MDSKRNRQQRIALVFVEQLHQRQLDLQKFSSDDFESVVKRIVLIVMYFEMWSQAVFLTMFRSFWPGCLRFTSIVVSLLLPSL